MGKKIEAMKRALSKARTLEEARKEVARIVRTDLRLRVTPKTRQRVMALHAQGLNPREMMDAGVEISAPTIRKIIRQQEKEL